MYFVSCYLISECQDRPWFVGPNVFWTLVGKIEMIMSCHYGNQRPLERELTRKQPRANAILTRYMKERNTFLSIYVANHET